MAVVGVPDDMAGIDGLDRSAAGEMPSVYYYTIRPVLDHTGKNNVLFVAGDDGTRRAINAHGFHLLVNHPVVLHENRNGCHLWTWRNWLRLKFAGRGPVDFIDNHPCRQSAAQPASQFLAKNGRHGNKQIFFIGSKAQIFRGHFDIHDPCHTVLIGPVNKNGSEITQKLRDIASDEFLEDTLLPLLKGEVLKNSGQFSAAGSTGLPVRNVKAPAWTFHFRSRSGDAKGTDDSRHQERYQFVCEPCEHFLILLSLQWYIHFKNIFPERE
jgi:hypothetical protein